MGDMVVRNLPADVHDQLRHRAAMNKRSLEAEVRAILTDVASSEGGTGFGDQLAALFDGARGEELSIERDKSPIEPVSFE